jgi:predicted nucleotidyltransferase
MVLADSVRDAILRHFEDLDFWRAHWKRSAVVVTGSTARGAVDEFADLDVNVYVPEASFDPLYADYQKAADDERVQVMNPKAFLYHEFPFVPMAGLHGHYRVYLFEDLERKIALHDDIAMWVHQTGIVVHDPSARYTTIQRAASAYPEDVWRERIRFHYLEAVLSAGAASNPLRRNDLNAVTLTMTDCVAHVLRLCCLLDRKPFPYDKWLYHEALQTQGGRELGPLLEEFLDEIRKPVLTRAKPVCYLQPGHRKADLEEFRLYVIWLQLRGYFEAHWPK